MTDKHPRQPDFTPDTLTPQRSLTIDAEAYTHFLADTDWSEQQKIEFVEALWQVVVGFVDMGFNLHPYQQLHGSKVGLVPDSRLMLSFCQNSETAELNTLLSQADAGGRIDSNE